jgi:hypothetical protein
MILIDFSGHTGYFSGHSGYFSGHSEYFYEHSGYFPDIVVVAVQGMQVSTLQNLVDRHTAL